MKKFLALVLALAMVLALGVAAFADAGSPSTDDGGGKDLAYRGPALNQAAEKKTDNAVKLVKDGNEVEIELVDISNADTLDAADKEAFLAAYEAAKAVTDKVVKYFFWVKPAGVEPPADFEFTCEGTGVEVTVNTNPCEVVAGAEENAYIAKLTEFGAVAILCDAAA